MISLLLGFPTPHPDTLRAAFEALAGAMRGEPVRLTQTAHTAAGDCFDGTWTADSVAYRARVASGPAHRDGVSYTIDVSLDVATSDGPCVARATADSWTPIPPQLEVRVEGLPLTAYPALRAALAALHETVVDLSDDARLALPMVRALRGAGLPDVARPLAAGALARVPLGAPGHGDLLEQVVQLDPTAGGVARLVRELPSRLATWRAAAAEPPAGLDPSDVTATLAHLCPHDAARWVAAGLAPPPWAAHPEWPVARPVGDEGTWWTLRLPALGHATTAASAFVRAYTGANLDDEGCEAPAEDGRQGWRWSVRRRARWVPGQRLPRVAVTLRAERASAASEADPTTKEDQTWDWLSGPAPGDVGLSVRHDRHRDGAFDVAFAWTVVGSPAFREEVRAAWDRVFPFRWEAAPAATSLVPRRIDDLPWYPALADAPSRRVAEVALSASGLSVADRDAARALLDCGCAKPPRGFCPHAVALLGIGRAQRAADASPADRLRSEAREQALQVAVCAIGAAPDRTALTRSVHLLHQLLLKVAELR